MLTPRAIRRSSDLNITKKKLQQIGEDVALTGEDVQVSEWCSFHNIQWEDSVSKTYHYKMSRLWNVPIVLYRMWDISLLDRSLLAIVWPRTPSSYLQTITNDLCERLWVYDMCTISGGAEGIDCLAHECSMRVDIPTIIVLGAWFRWYCNRRERTFFQRVVDAWGLVISERKLDQSPATYTFPQRNRIIAWCADVVFVPWAAIWSWSLITVDFALQFGIPVFTVPGSLYESMCRWTNSYLCQRKIEGIVDIDLFLQKFFSRKQHLAHPLDEHTVLSEQEKKMLHLLYQQPENIASLLVYFEGNLSVVSEILLELEMKNLIYSPEPSYWQGK